MSGKWHPAAMGYSVYRVGYGDSRCQMSGKTGANGNRSTSGLYPVIVWLEKLIDGGSNDAQWLLLRQSYDDDESMGACAPTRLMIYIIFDSFSLNTGYLRRVSHPEFNLSLSALESQL